MAQMSADHPESGRQFQHQLLSPLPVRRQGYGFPSILGAKAGVSFDLHILCCSKMETQQSWVKIIPPWDGKTESLGGSGVWFSHW